MRNILLTILAVLLAVPALAAPVDIILQIKAPYDQDVPAAMSALAEQAVALFGKGGNPGAQRVEEYLGYVNTPPVAGLVRVRIDDVFAGALEQMGENDVVRLVRVEWPDRVPEGGWPPVTAAVPCEVDGVATTCQVEVGAIQ